MSELHPIAASEPDRARPGRWWLPFAFAGLSLASGVLLGGISIWFLAAVALAGAGPAAAVAALQGPMAAIRLLAVSRTGAKYGERLSGHRAALRDQVLRRGRLFRAMAAAPQTRASGWQLRRDDRLTDFLDDVEDRDYARLRVTLPMATLALAVALLVAATAAVAPLALLPILAVAALAALAVVVLAPGIARRETAARAGRQAAGGGLAAVQAALAPLAAEGRRLPALRDALKPLRAIEALRLEQRRRLAALDAGLTLAAPLAALAVLLAAWQAGARDGALLPALFLAFAWLALAEALPGVSRALLGHAKAAAGRAELARWTRDAAPDDAAAPAVPLGAPPASLVLCNLALRRPDGTVIGRRPDGRLDRAFAAGRPTVITGPSGCGKTTLLKAIAGWLPDRPGECILHGDAILPAAVRRDRVHLCLHDAAILADTIRANLFAPAADEAALGAALAAVELEARVAAAGGLDAWITQATLSLGEAQRLNLARAFLSAAPILLLDEPVEHLDRAQGLRILGRLLRRRADRIIVVTSHHDLSGLAAETLRLGG